MHHAVFRVPRIFSCCAALALLMSPGSISQLCNPAELQSVCKDPEGNPGLWKNVLEILCKHCTSVDQCNFGQAATVETDGTADWNLEITAANQFQQDDMNLVFAVLWEAGNFGMTTDCPHGVIALLMTLYAINPNYYDQGVSIQRIVGFKEVLIRVSLSAQGLEGSFHFIADSTADLTPFPLSTKPMLAWSSWQDLLLQPTEPKCNTASLPADCAAGALGIDWFFFLVESCALCNQYFCYERKDLLDVVDKIVDQAWAEKYAGRPLPCAAGYFTALLIKSKRAAIQYSALETVEAKYIKKNEENMLHVEFRKIKNRTIFHTLPLLPLSPFPLDTATLHPFLSRASGVEQSGFHFDVAANTAWQLHAAGVLSFMMPGDSSIQLLNDTEFTGAASTGRATVFVPIEQRRKALHVLRGILGEHTHLVDRNGLVQVGPVPFESAAKNLPFRVFCESCVYANVVFYATDQDWLLPLHLWRPCRMPMFAIFPLQRFEWGGNFVQFANTVVIDFQKKTLHMQYEEDVPGFPSLVGFGVCRQQLLQVPEVQDIKIGDGAPWFPTLHPEFDISKEVNVDMSLVDLKMVRQLSKRAGLVKFLDKIQLKEWCREQSIAIPYVYHMSNSSPEVPQELLKMRAFVAKPAHLADSSHIYVMRDGVNLINGNSTSAEEVQRGLDAAFSITSLNDWATESALPGVIVEELVEPALDSVSLLDSRGLHTTPDEFRCHAVWGELLFCQWVWISHMSGDLEKVTSKGDWPLNQGHIDFGIPEFISSGLVFRDGSCVLCARPPPVDWQVVVHMVETVATGSDYLRVDIFIKDGKPVLNEVTITFAAISGFQPQLSEELRRRWLEGYFWLSSR